MSEEPIKKTRVFETPWFSIVAKTVSADGSGEPYYVLETPDYVSVLAVTPTQQVVMVRQYRPTVERTTLELPSGVIDPGETPAQAGVRELLEETQFVPRRIEPLGALRTDTGRTNNLLHSFFVEVAAEPDRPPEAGATVELVDVDAVIRGLLTDPTLNDVRFGNAFHLATLTLAKLRGLISF